MPKKVTHLIIGLAKGGAETMLYQILRYRTDDSIVHQVISMGVSSYYEEKILELGVGLSIIPIKRNPIKLLRRIRKAAKESDTLCCWMYHANLIGYIGSFGIKKLKRVWCIRHSNLDPRNNSRLTLLINKVSAKISGKIDTIAYNGEQARIIHEQAGYEKEKGIVLNNGCDLSEYSPQRHAREMILNELGIPENAKIILSVARYAPIKDLPSFVRAVARLQKRIPECVAIMCGDGVTEDNGALSRLWNECGLVKNRNIFPIGLRHDVPVLMSACDLYVLHSAGEAFPNTLIQAMACGAPVVATDVGDVSRILESDEVIVPAGDVEALCEKMYATLSKDEEDRIKAEEKNRKRVMQSFDIRNVVSQYERLF